MKKNLTNIGPPLYNDLFSNRKNYNKKNTSNMHIFPKINTKSLSPFINKTKNINIKRENETKVLMTDRPFNHGNFKRRNFFNNKKINLTKGIIHLKKEKYKKYGLSVKNIELEKNNENNIELNFCRLKDINMNDILKKKKYSKININNKPKISKLKINNDNNFPIEIYDINDNNKINFTERNLYKNTFIKNDNIKIYQTLKNFNPKRFNKLSNYDNKKNIANTNRNGNNINISNIFKKLLSNNISHTVELNNQSNKKISLEIVKNLLNEEINILNNNQIFLNEEIIGNLYKGDLSRINYNDINKSHNDIKKNILSVKEINYEKINDKNIIESNKSENYIKSKDIISKFKSFDLYTGTQIFDEKYFIRNNIAELKGKLNEDILNEENGIKEIGNILSVNSNIYKSRNQNIQLFPHETDIEDKYTNYKLGDKNIQTEFIENKKKNNYNKEELKNIINNIIFQTSYDINDNLLKYKNKDKKNSFTINNIHINGINCISMGDLYKKLSKNREITKNGLHKFKMFDVNNIKFKNYLKKEKNQDKKENLLLNNYLIAVENINEKIISNNKFNDKLQRRNTDNNIRFKSPEIKLKITNTNINDSQKKLIKSSSNLNSIKINVDIDNIKEKEKKK